MTTPKFPAKINRRSLLKGALASTALVPLLEAHRAIGQTDRPPVRLVVFATPNGTRNSLFWPTSGASGLTFPEYTAPLAPFQDKLLFLDGISHCSAVVAGGTGVGAPAVTGSEHARGMGALLTARPLGMGQFKSFNATSGWGSGISIDQHIAELINPPTRFKTLELGVHVRDAEVRGRISYKGADQPIPPRESPADVFNALFGGMMGNPDGNAGSVNSLGTERKGVYDITKREIARLQGNLGTDDRLKLQAYMNSIEEIEERLTALTGAGSAGSSGDPGSCAAPDLGELTVDTLDDSTLGRTGQLQMDLAAAALACDQTRIITLQWNYAESEHLFPFLNLSRNHHIISHDWTTPGFTDYGKIHVWFAQQLAYFLGKLASYPEGNGSLLDNTIVFWGSEIGESNAHDLKRMPYVLAGGGGGQLKPGRVVKYSGAPKDNNQLLVSLANMMGADIDSFGDPSGQTGPLPDLA
jgi:hypothetical protein